MLSITAIKHGYEDYQRHCSDNEINNRKCEIIRNGSPETQTWASINPGYIVRIEKDHVFPADVIIIGSSGSDKTCRIETAALDGETNLKVKTCSEGYANGVGMTIETTDPTTNLSTFAATVHSESKSFPVSSASFVPRGCVLRKTDYVYGLAVYTGRETKIMLNSGAPRFKYTELDRVLDIIVIALIVVLIIVCFGFTLGNWLFNRSHMDDMYLSLENSTFWDYVWQFFAWMLVVNMIIPLCVYSSLDLVRFFLGKAIDTDLTLKEGTKSTKCRNSDLVSTIGRVTQIFSDKTGTLTKNRMVFKSFSLKSELFSPTECPDPKNPESLVAIHPETITWVKKNSSRPDVRLFLLNICSNNSAVTIPNLSYYEKEVILDQFPDQIITDDIPDPGFVFKFPYSISYQTTSPDELALIHFARECGFILYKSLDSTVEIIIHGELHVFERPMIFEYSSERKRSSCVLIDNMKPYLLVKGADSMLNQRAASTMQDDVAGYGYRTLCFAYKELSIEEHLEEYQSTKMDLTNGIQRKNALADIIESDLVIYAFTGVEDELQDGIELTMNKLRQAGIKVWMLTGDRIDTALNIAVSSGLAPKKHKIVQFDSSSFDDVFSTIDSETLNQTVLAVEGCELVSILQNEYFAGDFIDLSELCGAVVVARCEPWHKGNLVRFFMKEKPDSIVLAVGDGANDVDMIRAANVGIGIDGVEGSEAVLSSDFSIPSFKFMAPLLIVHGRWCVNRTSLLIMLTFYKNMMMALLQLFYGIFNGWSATSCFDSGFYSMCNMILTIPQLFFICVFEQDIEAKYALALPQIYKETQASGGLALRDVLEWNFYAFFHAALIFFYSFFENSTVLLNDESFTLDHAAFTQITGWTLLFVFTIELLFRFRTVTWVHILLYIACILSYLVIEAIYSSVDPYFYGILELLFKTPRLWLTIPCAVGAIVVFDIIVHYLRPHMSSSLSIAVAELEYAGRSM